MAYQVMTDAGSPVSMQEYTAETFKPHVGEMFRFEPSGNAESNGGAGPALLELIEVAAGPTVADGLRQQFLLLFVLRSDRPLGPGLHRIVRAGFESCDWFLNRIVVPGRDPRAAYYQAVFG
jgi:hypothetical protein